MALDPKDRRWLKEWALKLGATTYLLFVFAFMAGHAAPGSMASLSSALTLALVPALIFTLAVLGIMFYWRRR